MQAQLGEQVALDVAQLLQQGLALLGGADHKHLHLGELVQPVQALAGRPCTTGELLSRWAPAVCITGHVWQDAAVRGRCKILSSLTSTWLAANATAC